MLCDLYDHIIDLPRKCDFDRQNVFLSHGLDNQCTHMDGVIGHHLEFVRRSKIVEEFSM